MKVGWRMIKYLAVLLLVVFIIGCSGPKTQGNPANNSGLYLAAWYVPYDSSRGLQSFQNNAALFDELNPVWYNLNPAYFSNGALPLIANLSNQAVILSIARSHGIKVLPTIQNWGISNFDATVISAIIKDPIMRSRHVADILNLVIIQGYDGIDIDYESLETTDREAFSRFIEELSGALHSSGKLLSVTIYAKTSDDASWTGPGAQDWPRLAVVADTIKVMAYDYHWVSFHAGPISPTDWLRAVLNYSTTVPELNNKLIVGLPFYGLDWPTKGEGREVAFADARKLSKDYQISNANRNSSSHLDPICSTFSVNVEPHFNYNQAGVNHTVYYQDRLALQERLAIINQYRQIVKGVTFWRLGGEDPEVWSELNN